MKAAEIMTARPITVEPEASVKTAVRLMLQHRISGLPVVNGAGSLVGIITEGDLLRRAETETQRRRPRWLEFLIGPGRLATEYVQASGRRVGEVMSRSLHTIAEDASLQDVVQAMETHRIKRLPVVRDGKLVGIVSRANLVHALATVAHEVSASAADDASIRRDLLAELQRQAWAPVALVNVTVRNGTVHLWGAITDERQRAALHVAAENIAGVKNVCDHVVWVEPTSGMVFLSTDEEAARTASS